MANVAFVTKTYEGADWDPATMASSGGFLSLNSATYAGGADTINFPYQVLYYSIGVQSYFLSFGTDSETRANYALTQKYLEYFAWGTHDELSSGGTQLTLSPFLRLNGGSSLGGPGDSYIDYRTARLTLSIVVQYNS